MVILSQPQGYIGTYIANAIEELAAHILNLFGLDPATTMYLQYTPPAVPEWYYELDTDDLLIAIARHALGPSDEKYELIIIKWVKSECNKPILERYSIKELPYWKPILSREAVNLRQELHVQ